ncbi:Transcription-repair-coupling factor [Zhongshania aliphaticivorans]|uniref:Transcription-repair-coupling factor n=1 Tax=Zhongshania aliphaticivorans TaxID=1470434 RepID=A0A5S9QG66_9GAMM|nr:transcription-repair coupling factor [Zhongshania aliphaticivorans]CAA0088326.1 Transcription-repair-coupling factor [Zhongshania aliphaticivorans]CAA0116361.1 Transcription-repair-coupling factor [Zhongshania aliphaticivorans]CAA0120431.1 Transcription-repair-coupling factor [Zhongshania aliphaticivorans]
MIELPTIVNPPKGGALHWGNIPSASHGLIAAELAKSVDAPILLLTADTASAYQLEQNLRFFCDSLIVRLLPDWETLPYDNFSPHEDIVSERLRTLSELITMKRGILVAPITTLMQRIAPPDYINKHSLDLNIGQTLDIDAFRQQLEKSGYHHVDTVYQHGEYASRGAIIDIFPMGSELPYRIDLLDDEIDSLRCFDPETQRGIDSVKQIKLLPGKELPLDENGIALFRRQWHEKFNVDHRKCPTYQDVSDGIAPAGIEYYLPLFFEQTGTLFDFLPSNSWLLTTAGIEAAAEHYWHDVQQRYEQRIGDIYRPILPPAEVFQTVPELFSRLKNYPRVTISNDTLPKTATAFNFAINTVPSLTVDSKQDDPIRSLREYCQNRRVLFCAESAGRREALIELLTRHKLKPKAVNGWQDFANGKDTLNITVAPLDEGIACTSVKPFALIAESELFGKRVSQSRRRKKSTNTAENVVKNLAELRIGAPVVHADHGVGRYLGLQSIDIDDQANEFLSLEYADGAKLYVPVTSLQLISRYSGADDDLAPLHRLGTDQWSKAKRKAAEKIRDVAAELLDIYARREARQGRSFALSDEDYYEFANAFPFEETPDQQTAIEAVVGDLKSSKPMDRLVCGDVGFGKTEVAVRAAFVAVQNHTQVAILVPTTLLAQQHFESFRDRFAELPVNIEVLSRFRSAAEQKTVIADLAAGKVDILIGTHKLLGNDISYSNLGLVIIDEEHRFGVRQKEALKNIRAEVDVLTLTATPIPRTLNMSMAGIRDLSIIATPPARRLSVKTFVRESDPALIKESILREILRGGQVYYLHNDVKTIEKTARDLQEMIPELRIGIGHGQMRERELEQVMSDFYHKRHNILVCSTIIETGIDVPNANTIIIDRADKFGLAQLHQLRGRVGRSHHQAYAYLLTPPTKQLTGDAEKRLTAISEADDLGAGFTLATQDMEIRGAGELLGEGQSGQIHTIGFTLYMDMLDRAVQAIKAGKKINLENSDDDHIEVNLRLPALIPDEYLPDVQSRLMLYKRIAGAVNSEALRELQVEMIDRFGLLPNQVKNLFRCAELRLQAVSLGLSKIEASGQSGRIEFAEDTSVEPLSLVQMVQSAPATYQLDGATALKFKYPMEETSQRFEFIESLLTKLAPKR